MPQQGSTIQIGYDISDVTGASRDFVSLLNQQIAALKDMEVQMLKFNQNDELVQATLSQTNEEHKKIIRTLAIEGDQIAKVSAKIVEDTKARREALEIEKQRNAALAAAAARDIFAAPTTDKLNAINIYNAGIQRLGQIAATSGIPIAE